MTDRIYPNVDKFEFRDLHPSISLGTTSDRYEGWTGQIYSKGRYRDKISSRYTTVGGKSFREKVLPVESVAEYFKHFSFLEVDYTFYSLLLDNDSKPTSNYHVLRRYKKYLNQNDYLILKVPQVIFAHKLWRSGKFIENPDYLSARIFIKKFYEPAVDLLGGLIKGFIFEQEYQRKRDRIPPDEYCEALNKFFDNIPIDDRYHLEIRTGSYLSIPYFKVLEKYGVGQVLSHWTWLPPLLKQFALSGNRFINCANQCIVRLMTPLKMKYEDAYKKAFPFNKMIDGMISPRMIDETVELMKIAIEQGVHVNVAINNRAGGNAPMIAQNISEKFLTSGTGRSTG